MRFLQFCLLFVLITESLAITCPLYRAERDADVSGRYIAVMEENVSDEEFQSVLTSIVQLSDDHKALGIVRFVEKSFAVHLNAMCLAIARNLPHIKYIEEEQMVSGTQDPNLPWYLDRLDQQTGSRHLDYQFAPMDTGEGVDIYILDTGISYDHDEFEGRAKYGGYDPVDIYHDNLPPMRGSDCEGHGTHVSSLAGGKTYGVARKANLFSVRVLDCNNFAPWSVVIDGIDYTARTVMERKRPAVVSLSLGGQYQQAANDAVNKFHELGIPVVVAAGNGKRSACRTSPASSPTVITVGATNSSDNLYWYENSDFGTNYGSCVDIFAPGNYILGANHSCSNCSKVLSGTSMSTPLVSGIVALYLQRQPLLSPDQIKEKLISCGLKDVLKFDQLKNDESLVTTNLLAQICSTCGGIYSQHVAMDITSPNYPGNYPHDVSCVWIIPVVEHQEIVLNVSDVQLEDGYDTLTIYTDSGEHQFTGSNFTALPLIISSTFFTLHLKTDVSGSGRGFNATFTKYYNNTPLKVPQPDIFPIVTSTLQPAATKPFIQVGVEEVKGLVSEWKGNGFDVWWITSYQLLPDTTWYFDVLFHNSTINRSRGYIELTSSELNSTIQHQESEGFAVYHIQQRYTEALGFRYCAVFREVSPLIEVYAYWNYGIYPHLITRLHLFNNRWSQVSQSYFYVPPIIAISAVYYRDRRLVYNIPFENPDEDNRLSEGLTFLQFTTMTLELHSEYYPEYVDSYSASTISQLTVLYKKYGPSKNRQRWYRWGLNKTEVVNQIVQHAGQWDPVYVVPYIYNGSPGYIVAWYLKRL